MVGISRVRMPPGKRDTDMRRKASHDLAMDKLNEGNVNAASELFQILRSEDIEFVVAPYEADAHCLVLICAGCTQIVFKMDRYGNGEEIVQNKIFESLDCRPSFQHFDIELFTGMCVKAGCDFLPSVPGIGIAKAYSLVSKYQNLDREFFSSGLSVCICFPLAFCFSPFALCFLCVLVFASPLARWDCTYDADSKSPKHIKPLPEKLLQSIDGDLDFLGIPSLACCNCSSDYLLVYAFSISTEYDLSFFLTTIREMPPSMAAAIAKVMGWKTMLDEGKFLNEAMELGTLVCPLSTQSTEV
ncbi:5'-3' exonuclease family protein [Actinidia rufa]|uniref:Exonuclease 1 n=1 Tax=Actinidia rufa TaxID=165716 RepID=A0A7J0GNB4_9ERIC|nr:5'-3' exonuclease family protein [Actinidia rufa]